MSNVGDYTKFETLDGEHSGRITGNFRAEMSGWGLVNRGTLRVDPTLADKGIEDILNSADLNFQPMLVRTSYVSPVSGIQYESESYSVIRADTDKEVGRGFSDGYTPVSYLESLELLFGDIRKLGGVPTRAISIDGGARALLQFILPDDYYVAGRQHKLFFDVIGSQDGTSGVGVNTSDTCIVCGNTYAKVLHGTDNRAVRKHTKNVKEKLVDISTAILAVRQNAPAYYSLMNQAAAIRLTPDMVESALFSLIPDSGGGEKRANSQSANRRQAIREAVNVTVGESNKKEVSAYDLFQGVLRTTSYRAQKRTDDEQYLYVTEGSGATLNDKAYAWLMEAAK